MKPFLITEVCGLEPERDETRRELESASELRAFIRESSIGFCDILSDLRIEHPGHPLISLDPDCIGVGFALTIERSDSFKLGIGIAPQNWALISDEPDLLPRCDGAGRGKLVFLLGDWTELDASWTYQPGTAWKYVEEWLSRVDIRR